MGRNYYTGRSSRKLTKVQNEIVDAISKHNNGAVQLTNEYVKLTRSGLTLHLVKCVPSKITSSVPFVIMHGYGAGSLMFGNNITGLAKGLETVVYSIDWVGFGDSSRPTFKGKTVQDALDFFLNPLTEWLEQAGLSKIDLMGHSMGGYLCGKFMTDYHGEKYVRTLILASPVGIPRESAPAAEAEETLSRRYRIIRAVASRGWSWNWTPSGFIRKIGSAAGGRLVHNFCERRFAKGKSMGIDGLTGKHDNLMAEYLHQLMTLPTSGELAFFKMFKVGAMAFEPLLDSLPNIDACPILFLYGDVDWMDVEGGRDCKRAHEKLVESSHSENTSQIEASSIEVTVTDGGHHLYADNSDMFNNAVLDFVRSRNSATVQ